MISLKLSVGGSILSFVWEKKNQTTTKLRNETMDAAKKKRKQMRWTSEEIERSLPEI